MEEYWIEDYALFMALKDDANGASWLDWEDGVRTRDEKPLRKPKKSLPTGWVSTTSSSSSSTDSGEL